MNKIFEYLRQNKFLVCMIGIFSVVEILSFFLLPIVTFSLPGERVKLFSVFYLLLNHEIIISPDIVIHSDYSVFIVIPYLMFIVGIVISLGKTFSKYRMGIGIALIFIASLVLLLYDGNVGSRHTLFTDDGLSYSLSGDWIRVGFNFILCWLSAGCVLSYNLNRLRLRADAIAKGDV